MTSAQKIIKYLALCLATFLIFLIISSLLGVFYSVSKILDVQKDNEVTMDKMSTVNFKIDSISSLNIPYDNLGTRSILLNTNNNIRLTKDKLNNYKEELLRITNNIENIENDVLNKINTIDTNIIIE